MKTWLIVLGISAVVGCSFCGGPAAECGCCPCAPGYIDDISC